MTEAHAEPVAPSAPSAPFAPSEAAAPRQSTYRVAAIPGDGVGPEVLTAGRRVLDAVGVAAGFAFDWT